MPARRPVKKNSDTQTDSLFWQSLNMVYRIYQDDHLNITEVAVQLTTRLVTDHDHLCTEL